jgi:hypothetical protein
MAGHHIDADSLNAWAHKYASSGDFPWLIRSLIRSSVGKSATVQFETGKGTYGGDFDGTVSFTLSESDPDAYVPAGDSVWEASTREDVKDKANEDFKKRSYGEAGIDRKNVTYVAATLRRFDNAAKTRWIADKRKLDIWRDVRFLAAEDLSEWLDQHVVVKHQLAPKLEIPSLVLSLAHFWTNWNDDCILHKLGDDWALAGRDRETELFLDQLRQNTKNIFISETDPYDALAFVYSALKSAPSEESETFFSKTLFIPDVVDFRSLGSIARGAILIPLCNVDERDRGAVNRSNTVIYCGDPNKGNGIPLPRITASVLNERMRRDGVDFELATNATRAARNGILSLRAVLGGPPRPFDLSRISPGEQGVLSAALFVNRWSTTNPHDGLLVAHLSGKTLEEVEATYASLSDGKYPLVRKTGHVWFVADDALAWGQLAQTVVPSVLKRFESIAPSVLVEDDPSFDLEESDRWMAGFLGKRPSYSGLLKNGFARTLAALSMYVRRLGTFESGQALVDSIVTKCLEDLSPRRWFALAPSLSLFAEASPARYLDTLEADLKQESPTVLGLFGKDTSSYSSGSRHSEVLWSLERLAWSRTYLSRAVLCFATLYEKGASEKSGNSPLSSLRQIFLAWHPCTEATVEERFEVIESLRTFRPRAYWALLMELLPQDHSTATVTSRPEFRDWGEPPKPQLNRDIWHFNERIVALAVEGAGHEPDRLAALSRAYGGYPTEWLKILLAELQRGADKFSETGKRVIWEAMRETYTRHRRYPEADWSMSEEDGHLYAETMALYEPNDPVTEHLWLFRAWVDLPEPDGDYEKRDQRVLAARENALRDVFTAGGPEAVLAMAGQAEEPGLVGQAADRIGLWSGADENLFLQQNLASDVPAENLCARGFAISRASREGMDWVDTKLAIKGYWSDFQRASLLFILPNKRKTWERVDLEPFDIQSIYWARINIWTVDVDGDEEFSQFGRRLLNAGRRVDLLHWLSAYSHTERSSQNEILMAETLVSLMANPLPTETNEQLSSSDLRRVLEVLSNSETVDQTQVARFEFYFMPLVKYEYRPQALSRQMAAEPTFFIEMLKKAYPLAVEAETEDELAEENRAVQRAASDVLKASRSLPGLSETGIDGHYLLGWMKAVREMSEKADLLKPADWIIGEWFAYAPSNDGTWPPIEVCQAIEAASSDRLDNAVEIGKANARGVTSRGQDDGGDQERSLAEAFRGFAGRRKKYPRVVRILNELADRYDQEAVRHDESAALRQDL